MRSSAFLHRYGEKPYGFLRRRTTRSMSADLVPVRQRGHPAQARECEIVDVDELVVACRYRNDDATIRWCRNKVLLPVTLTWRSRPEFGELVERVVDGGERHRHLGRASLPRKSISAVRWRSPLPNRSRPSAMRWRVSRKPTELSISLTSCHGQPFEQRHTGLAHLGGFIELFRQGDFVQPSYTLTRRRSHPSFQYHLPFHYQEPRPVRCNYFATGAVQLLN